MIEPEVYFYCLIIYPIWRILAGEVGSVNQVFGVCAVWLKLLLGNCVYMPEIKR